MKEEVRKQTIERINEDIKTQSDYESKKDELNEMSKSDIIKKYESLKKEVLALDKKYKSCNKAEDLIINGFKDVIIKNKDCSHDIWIYEGTYSKSMCDAISLDHSKCNNNCKDNKYCTESLCPSFLFNKYICLECGWEHRAKDWQEFEKNHFVLKKEEIDIDIEEYRKQYFELLYYNENEKANDLFIESFNNENVKVKTRK